MKYTQRSFNSRPASDSYRDRFAETFGTTKRKPCAWCNDTGLADAGHDDIDGAVMFFARKHEPCPKGCGLQGQLAGG